MSAYVSTSQRWILEFKKRFATRWRLLLAGLAVFIGLLLCALQPNWMQMGRNEVFDQFQRWQPREYWSLPVRIVDIDEESIRRLGQWPWPRSVLARLLEKLAERQPVAIAIDVLFAEADRTSPQSIFNLWNLTPQLRQSLAYLPDHDRLFADAIKQNPVVLGLEGQFQASSERTMTSIAQFVQHGGKVDEYLYRFPGAFRSLALFENSAKGLGALNFVADGDGVVRRVPLLINIAHTVVPSFAAEAVRICQGVDYFQTELAVDGVQSLKIGRYSVPTTEKAEMWLHFTPAMRQRYVPAWQVLDDQAAPDLLSGTVLIIGASALNLGDSHTSPLGETIPGAEVHAQAIEQLLTGQILQRPSWAPSLEWLWMWLSGTWLALTAVRRSVGRAAILGLVLICGSFIASWLAFSRQELLLDAFSPSASLLLVFALISNVLFFVGEHYQRWIRRAFSRYVSPNLVEFLVRHPDQLELGGTRRECSFVFTDLEGFTRFVEQVEPEVALAVLNVYIDRIVAIAFKYQGTLDRIVGDAVAIIFSAPILQADHQQRALDCALEIHGFARQYAAEKAREGVPLGQTYIGVHCGEVIVGNLGGGSIIDYRALGDAVNTTSRIQEACSVLGSAICVSEAIIDHCPQVTVRPIAQLKLRGKCQTIMAYQPITVAHDQRYADAYALMVSRDPQAVHAFERLAEQRPDDSLVALHLARLRAGETGDLLILGD
jgi:adenylate cyclase